jgi:hypothetical protein
VTELPTDATPSTTPEAARALADFADQHGLTVRESRAVDEDLLNRTVVLWTAEGKGLALVPTGQAPATTLLRLREEVVQRAEDMQRAIDFQASVKAGHVEDVEAWHARTSKAAS